MEDTVKFKDYLKEELKDPEFREAFDEEEVYASLAIQIAKIRQKKKLTQKELAKRLHTTQQTISRLENIYNKSYSLQTLIKLARILDKRVSVKFSGVVRKNKEQQP
jgi:DNA-binding XRE family transcriptional regulator